MWVPLGARAARVGLAPAADRAALLAWARALPGVADAWVGETTLAVTWSGPRPALPPPPTTGGAPAGREVGIPVRYDGADLAAIAAHTGSTPAEVARRHAAPVYTVRFLGFRPGFAYLGDVDPELRLPRRPTPRPRVPGGTVALAEARTAVYPSPGPGGWHLLGTAVGFVPFDPGLGAALRPGDRVRFDPTRAADPPPAPAPVVALPARGLVLEALLGAAFPVDGGRPGRLAEAVAPGGAMVPERLAAANRAVRNPDGAGALELHGAARLRARGRLWVAVDGRARRLDDGEALEVPAGWATVVAVRGGLTPARAAVPGAAMGVGGVLTVGAAVAVDLLPHPRWEPGPIRLLPGPDLPHLPADTFPRLLAGPWRIAAVDRVGARLHGPRLAAPPLALPSEPLVRGVVELPPDGAPIVLGPDHPTTGGYPAVAVVHPDDHGRLGALPPGAPVEFVPAGPLSAEAAVD